MPELDPEFHLETARLYLSHLDPTSDAHCEFVVRLYTSPTFVAALGDLGITTAAAARELIATRFVPEYVHAGLGVYLISLKPPSPSPPSSSPAEDANLDCGTATIQERLARSTPIGTISLRTRSSYTVPDLGFAVLPSAMRQGYTREAAVAVLAHAGLDVVLGYTSPTNAASAALFRTLGFENRGTRVMSEFGGAVDVVWASPGAAEDLAVYGL